MIELTEQLRQALNRNGDPLELLDPETNATYVVIRKEIYERLQEQYDDGPWTDAERDLLASEVDAMLDDDMAIEDAP